MLELAGASLGSTELPGQRAVLINGAAPVDGDGLLGVAALDVKRVTSDFEHGILGLGTPVGIASPDL